MPGEEYRGTVDWIFVDHDLQDIDHILLAEFEDVLRFGCHPGSLLGRCLPLAEDSRQSQRRSIGPYGAVAERRYNDVSVLLGKANDLLTVHVHVAVLIGASAMKHHDERQPGLTVPGRWNVQAIRHLLLGRRKVISAMLVSPCAPLRVWGS